MKTERAPFWQYFGLGAVIVFAAALTTSLLHHVGGFARFENDNLDRLLRARSPQLVDDIVLVVIDEHDYRSPDFKASSPLNPRAVINIIKAIAAGNPRVIAVDLDTSQWDADTAKEAVAIPKVVWARDGWEENGALKMENLLGGYFEDTCFGLPAVNIDDDGLVRRYLRTQEVGGLHLLSFPALIAEKGRSTEWKPCRMPYEEPPGGESEALIDYLGQGLRFRRLTASAIVDLSKTDEWKSNSDVNRKIVFLGGTFRAARDRYATPVGPLDGVEIAALETHEELSRKFTEAGPGRYWQMDIAIGLLLVSLFYFVAPRWRSITIAIVFLTAIAISITLFYTRAFFFSFVPVMAGVFVHEAIESALERRRLEKERGNLEKENRQLETEVKYLRDMIKEIGTIQ